MFFFDPFGGLANTANKIIADAWTTVMVGIWNAGLWVLQVVLRFEQYFLTPDITEQGPAQQVYGFTAWIAVCLVTVMVMIQLGTAAVRRDGASLARVLLGAGQFVVVWVSWIAYGVAVIAACAAINTALMRALFGVDQLGGWQPWEPLTGQDITDGVVATVLGMMGMLLWVAGIAHMLVLLTRAGALIVLAVTTPISAAGLVAEVGRPWFWKSFRWFHAAAFTPILMTLLMGVGVQVASGAAIGLADSTQSAIGSALPAVLMILMSAMSPLALFKLLAFVDPGTNSGAAARAGMAAVGGISGLLSGGVGGQGSGAAALSQGSGRSNGEAQAETINAARMAGATSSAAGVLGPVGMIAGTALRAFGAVAGTATALSADITNQMGVGHHTYQPDGFGVGGQRGSGHAHSSPGSGASDPGHQDTHHADGQYSPPGTSATASPPSGSAPAAPFPGDFARPPVVAMDTSLQAAAAAAS